MVFFGSNSIDICACICLILNIQVFILECQGLLLGLMISLRVNVFEVEIYVCKIHGLTLSCVFILPALYPAWDSVGGWWDCSAPWHVWRCPQPCCCVTGDISAVPELALSLQCALQYYRRVFYFWSTLVVPEMSVLCVPIESCFSWCQFSK